MMALGVYGHMNWNEIPRFFPLFPPIESFLEKMLPLFAFAIFDAAGKNLSISTRRKKRNDCLFL
jgi:hypothetical protein